MNKKRDFEENSEVQNSSNSKKDHLLTLHNDDTHDFEYVIESLVEVCRHSLIQAEQCTYLVHYRGACEVKKGKYDELKAMSDKLGNKGLTVSLN